MSSTFTNQSPDLTEIMGQVREWWFNEIHTAMPGVVKNYDAATQTATVLAGFKRKYRSETAATVYPALVKVPVMFPATATAWLLLPLAAGDTVMLHVCERALENWWINGGQVDPLVPRRLSLEDAVAVPGMRTQATPIVPKGASTSVELANGDGFLELTSAGKVKISNGTYDLLAALVDLMTQLTTAPNILAGPGTVANLTDGVVPCQFNVAVAAQLAKVKTKLEALKS